MLYQGGKTLELVDPSLVRFNRDEAAMCIQLGLLCCQQSIADRPDMNSVHLMLSSDSFTLPRPGKPGIQGRGGRWTTTTTSALTNSATAANASSTNTGSSRVSGGNSIVEEYSRNSMSVSSIEEVVFGYFDFQIHRIETASLSLIKEGLSVESINFMGSLWQELGLLNQTKLVSYLIEIGQLDGGDLLVHESNVCADNLANFGVGIGYRTTLLTGLSGFHLQRLLKRPTWTSCK
ncbi:unnamed protein product [Dovyalis caffra]|uniref:Uncharacterized protein n=1 Tax=Dovyalis caffra TaxID=77055 RepID=A0AAV1SF94_9ROSI|nr:unnamed protein product [Dovyalis caffra]